MNRRVIAFVVAPLAVPALTIIYIWPQISSTPYMALMAIEFSVVIAYAGVIVFGVPAFMFLRARNWTAFWIAPVLGFASGMVMWLIFSVLFVLLLDQGVSGMRLALTDPAALRGVVWPGGVLGAVVGTLLW